MSLVLGLAIYFIIWWLVLFTVLPFGITTQAEADDVVPGTPESAPASPRLVRVFGMTTVISALVFGVVYWVTVSPAARRLIDRLFEVMLGAAIFNG